MCIRDFRLPKRSWSPWGSCQTPVFFNEDDEDDEYHFPVTHPESPSLLTSLAVFATMVMPQALQVPTINVDIITTSFECLSSSNTAFPAEHDAILNQSWTDQQCRLASEGTLIADIEQLRTAVCSIVQLSDLRILLTLT